MEIFNKNATSQTRNFMCMCYGTANENFLKFIIVILGTVIGIALFYFAGNSLISTFIHDTCLQCSHIYISAGQRGLQLKLSPHDLIREVKATVCYLISE